MNKACKNVQNRVDKLKNVQSYPQPDDKNHVLQGFLVLFLWITLWIMWKDSNFALFRIFRAILYTNPAADRGFPATDFRNYS